MTWAAHLQAKCVRMAAGNVRSMWTTIDGARIHALAGGQGPPVVLVHGYGLSGAYMLPLARALASSCTTYAPDLPGQGQSDAVPDGLGISALADVLGDWIDAVGLGRALVVANSFGCQIVTDLAMRRSTCVGPLVLIGPTIDPTQRRAPRQLAAALRDSAREPFSLLAIAARDNAQTGIRALLATARSALGDRIEERLPELTQPAVVVWGEKDGFVGRAWAERVAALLPRGRLVVVPGEPHAVHYTRPDLVADIVLELLTEEAENLGGDLLGRFKHRDVTASDVNDARGVENALPLVGDTHRHEPVALAPEQ
jgi:2-hydroxy-6-oxonona-2,4-dienedioate hydrolase